MRRVGVLNAPVMTRRLLGMLAAGAVAAAAAPALAGNGTPISNAKTPLTLAVIGDTP